jgi:hypothetical protein
MFPGPCPFKQNIYSRPADLERHYKNCHAPTEKDSFPCDYLKCPRSQDPFTRKDHFRDHLRDFHKEDIGAAKVGAKARNHKNGQEYAKLQEVWLKERVIPHWWWRCARCLVRVDVRTQGWECSSCKSPCEEERMRRRNLRAAKEEQAGFEADYMGSMETAYHADEYPSYSGIQDCGVCQGQGLIQDIHGDWQPCDHAQDYSYYEKPQSVLMGSLRGL